jgi:N6-adenosine-specific RNA methylase IME4
LSLSTLPGEFEVDRRTLTLLICSQTVREYTDKFTLEYDTLSNQEILDIPIEKLSKKGFCFLWVLSGTMNTGYECLNKWGYECVDHLTWVKTTSGGRKAMISHGFYFLHSTEMCLVGYKCPPGERVEFRSKISNDLIIADIRKKSQKPDQLYTIIDLMMPGSKKIEIFARNNNLRQGWLSVGNQIGEVFEKWRNKTTCDRCKEEILQGNIRYKSKKEINFDVCDKCIFDVIADRSEELTNYFKLENQNQEDVLHHYHRCDMCGVEPIWGTRFQCLQCENTDYCESKLYLDCFDRMLADKIGCSAHAFEAVEKPLEGHGLPVHHGKRCVSCYQKPILGPCFLCADCNHLVLCQNCFFNCSFKEFDQIKGHDSKHRLEMISLAQKVQKYSTCSNCARSPIVGRKYKCDQCFNFELCELCYIKRQGMEFKSGTAHTSEHSYTELV